MRGPEPQVAVRPRSVAELSSTLDGIAAVFADADHNGRYEQASLASEQVLVAYELALATRRTELVEAIPYVEALRGQALCQYIAHVDGAIEEAAGPVRALYGAITVGGREAAELAVVAIAALRHVVDVAEAVP